MLYNQLLAQHIESSSLDLLLLLAWHWIVFSARTHAKSTRGLDSVLIFDKYVQGLLACSNCKIGVGLHTLATTDCGLYSKIGGKHARSLEPGPIQAGNLFSHNTHSQQHKEPDLRCVHISISLGLRLFVCLRLLCARCCGTLEGWSLVDYIEQFHGNNLSEWRPLIHLPLVAAGHKDTEIIWSMLRSAEREKNSCNTNRCNLFNYVIKE